MELNNFSLSFIDIKTVRLLGNKNDIRSGFISIY